jgi:hypothetical protein
MIVQMEQPITIGPNGDAFVGKRLLVGVRWTSRGEVVREEQFHGLILEADQEGLVVERADTGARIVLPPRLQAAALGEYRLHSTGEVVRDPDYLATWKFDQDEQPHLPELPRGVSVLSTRFTKDPL